MDVYGWARLCRALLFVALQHVQMQLCCDKQHEMPESYMSEKHAVNGYAAQLNGTASRSVKTDLYASWAPLYEVGQLAFSDTLQTLVHLCGIYLTLHITQTT